MSSRSGSSELDPDKLSEIVKELIKQPRLVERWMVFYKELGVTDPCVTQWSSEFKRDNLQPYELFTKILTSWLSAKGDAATKDSLWQTLSNVDKVLEREYSQKIKTQSTRGSRFLVFLGFFVVVVAMIYRNNENEDQTTSAVVIDERPETTSGVWYNVGTLDKHFVGRQPELNKLEEIYSSESDNIVVISGLRGIGKTELAKKFAHDLKAMGNVSVTWLNGESESTLKQSLIGLAQFLDISTKDASGKELGAKQLFNDVARVIGDNDPSKHWLLILDNVDEMNSDLLSSLQLLNAKENTLAILTSRNREVADEEMFLMELEEWTSEDAAKFIKLSLKKESCHEQLIIELCEKLGNHALGMQQAVGYIVKQQRSSVKGPSYSIADYLIEFEAGWKKTSQILDYKLSHVSNKFAKTTLVTWDITINKIKDIQGTGQVAYIILEIIAYFDPIGIPSDFVHKIMNFIKGWNLSDWEETFKGAVLLLKAYSLVKIENSVISVHRLLQQVIRIKLNSSNEEFSLLQSLLDIFDEHFPPFSRSELSQIVSVWNYSSKDDTLLLQFSFLPCHIFNRLLELGLYLEMEHFAMWTHRRLDQVLSENHFNTLAMKHNLAMALDQNGELEKSLEIYKEVWERKKEILGEEHESTLNTANNMATVLIRLNKLDKAMTVFEEVWESRKKSLGEFHPDTMATKHNIASVFKNKGELDVALTMFNEVLEWQRRELGERDQDTLLTRLKIAGILLEQGKYSEAKELFQDVVQLRKEVLGEEHPSALISMFSLGIAHFFLGEKETSLEILQQVLTLQKKVLGHGHPDTLATQELIDIDSDCSDIDSD